MAIYEYRCERDGPFDATLPIGTAPPSVACPSCGGTSLRVFTNPMVKTSVPRPLMAALNHEEKTRYEPDLVTSIPGGKPAPMARMTPQLAKLPRP